jgi:hypothetical protein
MLFSEFLKKLKLKGRLQENTLAGARIWTSNVLPISKETFIEISENVHPRIISKRHEGEEPIPRKI